MGWWEWYIDHFKWMIMMIMRVGVCSSSTHVSHISEFCHWHLKVIQVWIVIQTFLIETICQLTWTLITIHINKTYYIYHSIIQQTAWGYRKQDTLAMDMIKHEGDSAT